MDSTDGPRRKILATKSLRGGNVTLDPETIERLERVALALTARATQVGGDPVTKTEAQRQAIRLGLTALEDLLGLASSGTRRHTARQT